MQITDEEYLELLELEKERDSLKRENAELRNRIETLEVENEKLRQFKEGIVGNAIKCGACAENLFCGGALHNHDADCVYAERDPLRQQVAALTDNPENDCTDFAHPAWWRGNDDGCARATARIQEVLDGKDDGSGVIASPELEKVRRSVLELRQQVERLTMERDAAEHALERKGYRKSCSIPACNCGDTWNHGGHAEERLREISDEVWENGVTTLESVKRLRATVERMDAALKPFATAAEKIDDAIPDNVHMPFALGPKAGHCRAARKAMEIYETKTSHDKPE